MAESAKKASAKSSKKPAADKATKSIVSKSDTKKASLKSDQKVSSIKTAASKKRVLSPLQKLVNLHLSSAFGYIVLAVVSWFGLKSTAGEVALNYQAKDVFESGSNSLSSASEVLFNLQYRYLLVATLVLAAVGLLLIATKLKSRYETGVNGGISAIRWFVYGLSAAMLLKTVSVISGVSDLGTIELSAGLVFVSAMFGWLSDRENVLSVNPRKMAMYASVLTGLLALIPLAINLLGTLVYSTANFTWHVYALFAVLLLGLVANSMNLRASILKKAKFEYVIFENRYIRIDQVIKILVVIIVFALLSKNG